MQSRVRMRESMKIVLAFLAFLAPAAVGWAQYWSLPRPQPQALRDLTAALDDARESEKFEEACAKLAELTPLLQKAANGSLGSAGREPYANGLELVQDARESCQRPSFVGVHAPDSWNSRLHRIVRGLRVLDTRWDAGWLAPCRMSVFIFVPIAIILGFITWRSRRRERLLLETA